MEFLNRELLYAMRVLSHGAYNLCPSDTCNPGADKIAHRKGVDAGTLPPEFEHYPEVPSTAVETGQRLMAEGGLDLGGIEYLETVDGRLVFYDINANSNLRLGIAGFDPFDRVVEFLVSRIQAAWGLTSRDANRPGGGCAGASAPARSRRAITSS